MSKSKKAVASENVYSGIKINYLENKEQVHMALSGLIPNSVTNGDIVFVCIGTDRSTGDSLGPWVGTYLIGLGYTNVYGTIDDPVHAMNLQEVIDGLPKGKVVIAIDATLGQVSHVGKMSVIRGSIKPGAGVGRKDLPSVGEYGIHGCVNVGGFQEYFVLQNTRLSAVIRMSKDITSAIVSRFPLDEGNEPKKTTRKVKDETLIKQLKSQGLSVEIVSK